MLFLHSLEKKAKKKRECVRKRERVEITTKYVPLTAIHNRVYGYTCLDMYVSVFGV